MTCNCATHGSAKLCPVHTQADYDAAERDRKMSDDELRNEVGKAIEPVWWIRQYLDDDSEEAKAFDTVREFAQGLDKE